MNRFEKIALLVVILVTLLSNFGTGGHVNTYYRGQMDDDGLMMWIAGWIVATYGPIATAACFWRWSRRFGAGWILHLLFLPCAIILFNVGEGVMLSVIQDPDFDATIGGPILPATFLLSVAVGMYLAALIARFVMGPSRGASRR